MTVCIAAICGGKLPVPPEDYIVAVSDMMFTGLTSSIDKSTRKMEPFGDNWMAMMAADDVTQFVPIIERAATYIGKGATTLQVARSCLKRAYQQHLSEMAADKVVGRFGLDMEGFLKSDSPRFNDNMSDRLMSQIEQVRVDCQFLAFGFDSDKTPHIFTVEEPGTDCVYDKPGFCSVGSGKYAADTLLFYLEQTPKCSLHHTLVNVLFAKYMAEKAGAGTNTYIFVMKAGSTECAIDSFLEPTIRKAWDDEGHPHIPKGFLEKIAEAHISAK